MNYANELSWSQSYQNAVAMGTHSGSKPLMGLELNLSVHIINIKISITWKKIEDKYTCEKG